MEFGEFLKTIREQKDLSIRQLAMYSKVSAGYISQVEGGKRGVPSPSIIKKLSSGLKFPYEELMAAAGYLPEGGLTTTAGQSQNNMSEHDKITSSISDDPELAEFWDKLKEREDLQIFFKQTKDLSPAEIKKVMRIIKAIEDEEAADSDL